MEPFEIGKSCLDSGDYDSAIRHFTEAIRLAPLEPRGYDYRGWAYGKKGDLENAIADFSEAIRLNPNDAHAYYNRGYAYSRTGNSSNAIADLTEAIRLKPEKCTCIFLSGMCLHGQRL